MALPDQASDTLSNHRHPDHSTLSGQAPISRPDAKNFNERYCIFANPYATKLGSIVYLNIPRKLGIIVGFSALICFGVAAIQLLFLRDIIWQERSQLIKAQVETAQSIVQAFKDLSDTGTLTENEAKERAAHAVSAMRYGKNDYFFVTDYAGEMLVHPTEALIGKVLWDKQDPNGLYLFRELISQARAGGGETAYLWPRTPDQPPVPKLSYSTGIKGWDWMLGTGVYVDDLNTIFVGVAWKSLSASAVLLAILAFCAWPLARSISQPISRLSSAMRRLADGDMSITIPNLDRQDEIGEMAEAVQSFKAAAIERDRLAREANETRLADSLAKERQVAIDNAKAEDLRVLVAAVERSFERLSAGDLTVRMDQSVAPEFVPIQTQFNDSVSQLEEAIGGVVSSVQTIRTGLSEIAIASNDLSQRTEQQAASIEETVAALSEVSQAVAITAESAGQARASARLAATKAEQGGAIVGRAVLAMEEIEDSSQKINDIIGVIDEIAFQTNLLALNAGVEAARAGEAGKGFAVVAQEVRELAQRSATAAKEIKDLISTSRARVGAGVDLVTASGRSLEEIVAEVNAMTEVIATIASSATEQASSLREVSDAAEQMDKVTQQNAAMVEETTAATKAVEAETEELARSIGRFDISQGEGTHKPVERSSYSAHSTRRAA
ncbi:methyl-accepting chemotaxis protein [Fulvimarina manganoxydans]|nr:methyl-accepting chemotaxis protein [Fulvimarina manganoxydans]